MPEQDNHLRDLIAEINRFSGQSFILSSEIFPMLNGEAVDELLALFPGIPVKAVFYVRDIREHALSLASQIVKSQQCRENDDRLSTVYHMHISFFCSYYLNCLKLWEERIGKENIIFRKYGKEYFKGGNIYADFLDAVGIDLTDDFVLPGALQHESLAYAETIHFKDLLNRLTLGTTQEILEDNLVMYEKSNRGRGFFLPGDISTRIEEDASRIHRYLLDNYLDTSYVGFFDKPVSLSCDSQYKLSYSDFTNIIDYMDKHIDGFKEEFIESLVETLERTYEYELKLREFESVFARLMEEGKSVALWGTGDIADKLFRKHKFLKNGSFYIIDKSPEKQGGCFWGHEVVSPAIILKKSIDTIVIASVNYADEISKEIADKYPGIKNVITVTDLLVICRQSGSAA